VTVSVAVPDFPSLVAVITAVPGASVVIAPAVEIEATPGALEVQTMLLPVSTCPFASFTVAVACVACPASTDADASDTETNATGIGVTVIADVPVCPSLVAVIVALPAATAVTNPSTDTVATPFALDDQVTTLPPRIRLWESRNVAPSCWVLPSTTLADEGVTATVATGAEVTVSGADPLMPSLVAAIVAEPTETAVTRPVGPTVAIVGWSDAQLTARPLSSRPFASLRTTVA
jgi:hypothetical protein